MKLKHEEQFYINLKNNILCVRHEDLLFVQACRSYSLLTFYGPKTFKISRPMGWVIAQFGKGNLIKCHKSFAINRFNIESIDPLNRNVSLKQGITVPISIRELSKVRRLIKN